MIIIIIIFEGSDGAGGGWVAGLRRTELRDGRGPLRKLVQARKAPPTNNNNNYICASHLGLIRRHQNFQQATTPVGLSPQKIEQTRQDYICAAT